MSVEEQLALYRAIRRDLEQRILPLATSVDGRRFTLQTSLYGLELETGGYVVLAGEGVDRLGQLQSLGQTQAEGPELEGTRIMIRAAAGEGVVLDGDGKPFHDALARPATPEEVAAYLERVAPPRARLEVGSLLLAPGRSACARRGRVRPAHVPVRPVGVREDVRARRPCSSGSSTRRR